MSQPASFQSQDFPFDKLFAGHLPPLSKGITLLAGQNLTRGAVLGKITASGKYTLSAAAAGDGSEVPDAILAEDCDATAGDRAAVAYTRGDFNEAALTFGAGHTAASTREGLRDKGLYLVKLQA